MTRLRIGAVALFFESCIITLFGLAALPMAGFAGDGGDGAAVATAMVLLVAAFGLGIVMLVFSVLIFRGHRAFAWPGLVFACGCALEPWFSQASGGGAFPVFVVSAALAFPAVCLLLGLLTEKPGSRPALGGNLSPEVEPVPRDPR